MLQVHHINADPGAGAAHPPGHAPSHSNASDVSHGVTANMGIHTQPVPAASAALRTSFAPLLATTMMPSPDSSIPSGAGLPCLSHCFQKSLSNSLPPSGLYSFFFTASAQPNTSTTVLLTVAGQVAQRTLHRR